ncbi:hypothetical protein HZ994_10870 [Akkermansiaceae bacterium]|nr:hypothetical protein HZ994_10870 [Akkermansiaceae bacterium]
MKAKPLAPSILLAISGFAIAQMPPPPDIVAVTIDKDHDHKLTAREIRNAPKSLLKLDEDEDGALSAEELRPEPPDGRRRKKDGDDAQLQPPPPPPSALMDAIDTDGDGTLSKDEIEKSGETLLELDKDDDGKIDNTEAPSLGEPNQGGPPGGGGGRPPHPPGPPHGR